MVLYDVTVNGSIRCNSIRVYRDHQFAKLFRMKYIVGYLIVDVSKAPSRTSRTRHTEKRNQNLPMMEKSQKNYSSTTLGLLREPLYNLL